MRVGQELLDRVAIPGKPVWNEAVVAWTKHRDAQKPVDQQLARVRVKVTLNRMAIDWNTDKKHSTPWLPADQCLCNPHQNTERHRGRAQVFGSEQRCEILTKWSLVKALMNRRGRCNS